MERQVSPQAEIQQKKHIIFIYLLVHIGYQSVHSVGQVTEI